ncbi:DUF2235 domain-containing protein [Pseudonocardia sp. NPDC046786]|uniref:DUF2235 domain-containing protein n=1 Tax=Pseudonocardia sp. NPDC046786 TaxID=3155471 RepID=UPI0033E628CE
MRFAVFMDGTWNDPADGTHVALLHDRTAESGREDPGGGQQRCYVEGVGNGPWDRIRGGAFGHGVDDTIRRGYRFLAERHRPGDEIYLFGYSRGAFTARSLAGMITRCGLVAPDVLTDREVFDRYRDLRRPGLREMTEGEDDPGRRTAQDRTVLARSRLERIRFIGVFDTVGSLGIPGDIGKVFAHRYRFHDTALSGYVDVARHAVALDEDRPEFTPTLWTAVPVPVPDHPTSVEQRWFVGAHSDVGGGGERSRGPAPLSALPREWIADQARAAGLDIGPPAVPLTGDEWRSAFGDPYPGWLAGLASLVPGRRPYLRPVNTTERETLAPSLRERWERLPGYRPRNPNLAPWLRRSRVPA